MDIGARGEGQAAGVTVLQLREEKGEGCRDWGRVTCGLPPFRAVSLRAGLLGAPCAPGVPGEQPRVGRVAGGDTQGARSSGYLLYGREAFQYFNNRSSCCPSALHDFLPRRVWRKFSLKLGGFQDAGLRNGLIAASLGSPGIRGPPQAIPLARLPLICKQGSPPPTPHPRR